MMASWRAPRRRRLSPPPTLTSAARSSRARHEPREVLHPQLREHPHLLSDRPHPHPPIRPIDDVAPEQQLELLHRDAEPPLLHEALSCCAAEVLLLDERREVSQLLERGV